jgi:hypothetical protein
MTRQEELQNLTVITVKELAEMHGIDVLTVYKRIKEYPECLDLERGSKPLRIKNNKKAKNFKPDVRHYKRKIN